MRAPAGFFMRARHGQQLSGESAQRVRQQEVLAEGKGVTYGVHSFVMGTTGVPQQLQNLLSSKSRKPQFLQN